MSPDKLAPLMGLSAAMLLAMGSLVFFCLLLSALIPFTLLGIRKQAREQLEVLRRIEERLRAREASRDPNPAPSFPPQNPV